MDVGLRELKQNLSEYLHRAERGEVIRVTDRGAPIAQLGPLPGVGRLNQGIEEGWIRAPQRPGALQPFTRLRADARVVDVLRDDRGT
jgi:prevent-host-death family protein